MTTRITAAPRLAHLHRLAIAIALLFACIVQTAQADVRLTFWSRDTSSYFPHAFITMKGTLDSTGEIVDTSYGFTLNTIGPAALFGSVPAHIDVTNKAYIRDSDAQFQVRITDAQYAMIRAQVAEWGAPASKWNLNRRNCVHFVAEAARRAGLTVVEDRKLMKKPKSFTRSLIPLNRARVAMIDLKGADYFARYPGEEITGVPATDKDSVLERRMKGRISAS